MSNIESCTEESRLLLNLQACPDVAGTESTGMYTGDRSIKPEMGYSCRNVKVNEIFNASVEELTCLATWKDGNSRYLVGLVSHHHAVSNEERYRCFVYEKILSSGKLYCACDFDFTNQSKRLIRFSDELQIGNRKMLNINWPNREMQRVMGLTVPR